MKSAELLKKAKALQEKIKEAKNERSKIFSELASAFTPEEKQKQIKEAEKILENAQQKLQQAKAEYKEAKETAKEMLELVQVKHSCLKRTVNKININEKGMLVIEREGNVFQYDIKKEWYQTAKKELTAKFGESIARNLVYKASILVKN